MRDLLGSPPDERGARVDSSYGCRCPSLHHTGRPRVWLRRCVTDSCGHEGTSGEPRARARCEHDDHQTEHDVSSRVAIDDLTVKQGSHATASFQLRWAAMSHVGNVRSSNEDSFLVAPGMFVVADGMGGHQAGATASALAVAARAERPSTQPLELSDVQSLVQFANRRVFDYAVANSLEGMGTTLVGVAVVSTESLSLFHVGDSRVYSIGAEGQCEIITHDHSVVQELIDAGQLSAEAAETHPERNVVTRALGLDPTVTADVTVLPRVDRCRILLCSDGISSEMSADELCRALEQSVVPGQAVSELVTKVLGGPARDNLTAVVIDVTSL